ncbi:MAG: hypothetical protein FJ095_04245 [Deltaproteobacteria bacterium]|nr:hypothetical protein [Deltaproteobacteria bacterium]
MRRATCIVIASAVLHGGAAFAGSFTSDGTFAFSPFGSFRLDFEGEALPPLSDPEATAPEVVVAADALSGEHVLKLGAYESVSFSVTLPPALQTYRASVWIRGGEAVGIVRSSYDGERRDEAAVLYPTGRMTSDGWVELANVRIPLDGARGPIAFGVFAPAGAEVDAFELVKDGETTREPGRACSGVSDTASCVPGEVCTWGACRRVSGWVPPIPDERESVTNYLENRLEFLFGPYENRARDLPAAKVAIEAMRDAKEPWAFWNGFLLALRRLHDSHTGIGGSIAEYALRNPRPIDACFLEGDADWSHDVAPRDPLYRDVLVSHVGPLRNLGLRSGDRLVRVDGRHPIDWARSMTDVSWSLGSASNHSTFAEHAAALRSLVSRYARTLEVVRCSEQGCGALETIDVLSLEPLGPDEEFSSRLCDNRPLRHVPGAPDNHQGAEDVFAGFLEGSPADEKLFGIEWDSLYTTTGQDGVGPALGKAVARIGSEGATGVVLDHRRGTGGTLAGPSILWSYAVKRRPLTFFESRRRAEDEQPTLADGKALFTAAVADGTVDYAGSKLANPVPIALLITSDISASDWLPLGMKGAKNVRLFGPYETSGAFSTRLALGYWLGMSFTLASGDTYVEDGRTINGFGVPPDEVVVPRQSDLARGRDTVFEAALAWLRAQNGGTP